MDKRRFTRRIIALIVAAALAAVSACTLLGCFLPLPADYSIAFTQSRLTMKVGDEYDLSGIIQNNAGKYELKSSSSAVASVSGSVLTAHKTGTTTITATATYTEDSAYLRVTVVDEDSFAVEISGELCQTAGVASDISFIPIAVGSLSSDRINWYVDGTLESTLGSGAAFVYKPTTVGEHIVRAVCDAHNEYSAEHTVRLYYEVTASGSASGAAVQYGEPYTDIALAATVASHAGNPQNTVQWYVDGTAVYSGPDLSFTYKPTAGTHTVTLKVNGVARLINGLSSLKVVCHGSVVPDALELVFDNMYPHVYLKSNVLGKARVKITSPDGTVREYSQTDSKYSGLFSENGFDVGQIVSVCATGTRGSYKFRVKSLGDGSAYGESEYSAQYKFTQLPYAAKKYIENIYCEKDHYITSDEEYVNMFEYYVLNRPKTSSSRVKFDCYVGYDTMGDPDDLWQNAFQLGATSGSYTGKGAELDSSDKNILHTDFTVSTVNNPTRQTRTSSNSGSYSKQLHSNIPHINYDADKYRPAGYEFAIDKLERTQSVRYTDELYFAAENNTRPLPVAGSAAATAYELARDVLRKIVTDDMTDAQKAHAIYDWIMWQVTYDTPATKVKTNGESYSAYYLEGVFGNGSSSMGGVVYYPYAVCDGMSKAYSLMCNIEGIPCLRIAGMAGSTVSGAGGHAWNKVCIDGKWYIADCTWGDAVSKVTIDGRSGDYELGLHDWLFVTDDVACTTHFEPFDYAAYNPKWGNCDIDHYPHTAAEPYNVYKAMTYNGVTINCEVAAGENQSARVQEIATAFAGAYKTRTSVYVPGYSTGNWTVNYESIEVHFETKCTLSQSELLSVARTAIRGVKRNASCEVVSSDANVVLILMRA